MQRIRVKICGVTNPEDAIHAVNAGADAIGFVFYEKSSRFIKPEAAQDIISKIPPFINCVGLFVNANKNYVEHVMRYTPIDTLQFHGQETVEACAFYGKPYIKAIRMTDDIDLAAIAKQYPSAQALLLDSYVRNIPGGTGVTFDWQKIPDGVNKPLILAGGLTSSNIKQAIAAVSPYAVDVSGGVEASKGKKDKDKLNEFVREVING